MGKFKKREFDPSVMDHFFDSVKLTFDKTNGIYKNATIYDGTDKSKKFNTVTDAKNANVQSLVVVIEATHDGKTENFTEYVGEKMEKSTPTWTAPYAKPVLKYHNSFSGDPIGRVSAAEFGDSLTHPGSKTIFLSMDITEPDAIEKFLDGRYSTVSIGARVKELTCQVCGREILKDGFCGHWLGEKYKKISKGEDGKDKEEMITCYWTIGECTYYEVSVVNTPADVKQTGPLQMIKKKGDSASGASGSSGNNDGGETDDEEDSFEMDDIANFLDGESQKDKPDKDNEEGDEDNADDDPDGEEPGDEDADNRPESGNDEENDGAAGDSPEENAAKITGLTAQIAQLKTDNELLQTANSALQIENEKLSSENNNIKNSNQVLTRQLSTRTEQTLKLGRQIKEIMKNTIVTLGRAKIDEAAYAERTIVDIKKEFDNIINRVSTIIPPVSSPGLVNNNAAGVDQASEGTTANNENERKTLQDYANAIIKNKKKEVS